MAELVEFTESTLPRPEPFVRHYVRRIEPWYGFAIYGVLWFFVAMIAFAIGVLPGFALAGAVGIEKTSLLARVLGIGGGVLAFAAAWIPFVRWCVRKRGRAEPLVREGKLYDGRVSSPTTDGSAGAVAKQVLTGIVMSQISAEAFYVRFERSGEPRMLQVPAIARNPALGTALPVLFHPTSPYAFVFIAGKAHVAKVTG